MYSFKYDYSEGCHPRILQALLDTNMEQQDGYGDDAYCREAAQLIKRRLGRDDVDIHFFAGGTLLNLTAISSFLRPHQAVISAATGHINVHEAGAVEATGHKVVTVERPDGKLRVEDVEKVLGAHYDEHMVRPKLVYISNATEVGTVYNKEEIVALSQCCRKHDLLFYVDGARLGSAICAQGSGLELRDMAELTDAFYIGGTKNGALLGEALVICRDDLKEDFRHLIKQRGALMAKGRLLGLQFRELFKDDLFFELARHANCMADTLRQGFESAGFGFLTESRSNMLFPVLPKKLIAEMEKKYGFYVWADVDEEHAAIRLLTSWATTEEAVSGFLAHMKSLLARNR